MYAVIEGSFISLHDLKTNTTSDLVSLVDIRDVNIHFYYVMAPKAYHS